jgi:hypothetical protein
LFALLLALSYVSVIGAQQCPIMDMVANKVVQKYESSTCEQLWQERVAKKPPTQQEQEAVQALRSNPQMRAEFFSKVAVPIANKTFECGMIP